jgi:putative ABC transport system permease protein
MQGQDIPTVITGVVDYFPTLDPDEKGFLIVNFDRVSNLRNLVLNRSIRYYPNEVWLTVTGDEEQRASVLNNLNDGEYRARKIYDQQAMIAKSKADPLVAAGWGGILLIAFLGVILVSGLGFMVYAYLSVRARQLEFAILRTLGFSMFQIVGLFSFEQLLIISAGMGIGTLIGLRLSGFMMPFLQLTEMGEKVLPPFVVTTDWGTIGTAYIILTVIFILTVSLVVLFFSRIPLHRAMRLTEE